MLVSLTHRGDDKSDAKRYSLSAAVERSGRAASHSVH
jgi:hypothetical protein